MQTHMSCGQLTARLGWPPVLEVADYTSLSPPFSLDSDASEKGKNYRQVPDVCQDMFGNQSFLSEARGGKAMWVGHTVCIWPTVAASPGPGGIWRTVGLPIIYGTCLREVLEHILESPFSLVLGFGSRNDSKSFGSSPQRWWDEVQQL